MLLWLVLVAADPGTGLDLPPAEDPVGRLIATVVAIAVPVSAVAVARIQAKKSPINGPAPISATDSPTPRLDAGQEYLQRFIQQLESRVVAAEDRAEAAEGRAEAAEVRAKKAEEESAGLRRQVVELVEDRATFRTQNDALREDVAELREAVHEMRGRLRGRHD